MKIILAAIAAALLAPASALASGGTVTITGGTSTEQATAQRSLDTDRFPWALAGPVTVTITTDPTLTHNNAGWSEPGTVWISAAWLDTGNVTILQHEMAHQVDYHSLTDGQRTQLLAYLGGTIWANDGSTPHDQQGSERFAEELTAIYGGTDPRDADIIRWRPALEMDSELVKIGVLPAPLLNHTVCNYVRVKRVKIVKHKRRIYYVRVRRCHTV